jgi:ferritin-like protein
VTDTREGDAATSTISTRRGVLGASLAGTALSLIASRSTSATVEERVSDADLALLSFAQSFELSARDLYTAARAAGADDPFFGVLADQHEAFAQGIASFTGVSADTRDDGLYDELEPTFAAADRTAVATAGYDLESVAVATHTELLARLANVDAAKLVASMLAMEARHCTVLGDLSGRGDDLNVLLVNTADPILPEGSS